jgi:hypothetical protein
LRSEVDNEERDNEKEVTAVGGSAIYMCFKEDREADR